MNPTTVLLADDHSLVRHGIRRIVESHGEFQVVAEARSGIEAVREAIQHRPHLAILDIGMSQMGGIGALERIRDAQVPTRAIMVSMHADERYVRRAVQRGASGYVLKDGVEEELIEAMLAVRGGGEWYSPSITRFAAPPVFDELPEDPYHTLTVREREIYQLLAEGKSNKEIAGLYSLSLHTVETHRARIMEKMSVHTAAELVITAVRRGLIA